MKRFPGIKRWGAVIAAVCMIAASAMTGCKDGEKMQGKVQDLEFTVVGQNEVPQELMDIIGEKKTASFRLTYSSGEDLYIAAGYGEQATGGYSISVPELYLTDNSIVIKTELKGPDQAAQAGAAVSYPFLVVKTGLLDKPVVFQ